MTIEAPSWLFGRSREWDALIAYTNPPVPTAGLAIMYGRRRQGKTALLEALSQATGGFYWQALQQSSTQNLLTFSEAWSAWSGTPNISFPNWATAMRALFATNDETIRTVAIDEFGYLVDTSPEIPSIIQSLLSPKGTRESRTRLILCGSSYSQIRQLLAGDAPLRGRASLELAVGPFGYRDAAAYWGLADNLDAAFRLHALVGGTPGYLPLAGCAPKRGDVDSWLAKHVLNPSSPLYREGRVLVGEDTVLADRALYWSVLAAVADGHHRRGEIAAAVGRADAALTFPLKVLADGAWIEHRPDPFHVGRSTIHLSEPMLRLHRIVIEPEERRLNRGLASDVVRDTRQRVARLIYGPHLEWMAAEWALAFAKPDEIGGNPRSVGSGTLSAGGNRFQLDLVALEPGPHGKDQVHAIGEVKAGTERVGVTELDRLDAVAMLLGERGAASVKRLLVGRAGFTAELERAISRRSDVQLVDLRRLYGHA